MRRTLDRTFDNRFLDGLGGLLHSRRILGGYSDSPLSPNPGLQGAFYRQTLLGFSTCLKKGFGTVSKEGSWALRAGER